MAEIMDGVIIDGDKSIPLDERNADCAAFLKESGMTLDEVVAEATAVREAVQSQRADERDRVDRIVDSARKKLLGLGFTADEATVILRDNPT